MNILLLGGSGQDAFYLTSFLAKKRINVTWIYRGNALCKFQQYFSVDYVSFVQVESYCFDCLVTRVDLDQFDSVVLIAGVVGNQKARFNPLYTYTQNMEVLNTACSIVVSSSKSPHLYYFSTSDVDGTSSTNQPSVFSQYMAAPKTIYGLSKLHGSEYLKALRNHGIVNSTIVYFGMHESFYRSGDYVLSKIKQIINAKKSGQDPYPMSFGNLNIYLDIGFAQEYMNVVGQLIFSGFKNSEVVIGTGRYSNLHELCIDILSQFNIDPSRYILIEPDQQKISYYPLVPFSLAGLPLCTCNDINSQPLICPVPLTGKVLKSEYTDLAKNE